MSYLYQLKILAWRSRELLWPYSLPAEKLFDSQWLSGEEESISCVKLPPVDGPWPIDESQYHCVYMSSTRFRACKIQFPGTADHPGQLSRQANSTPSLLPLFLQVQCPILFPSSSADCLFQPLTLCFLSQWMRQILVAHPTFLLPVEVWGTLPNHPSSYVSAPKTQKHIVPRTPSDHSWKYTRKKEIPTSQHTHLRIREDNRK